MLIKSDLRESQRERKRLHNISFTSRRDLLQKSPRNDELRASVEEESLSGIMFLFNESILIAEKVGSSWISALCSRGFFLI
jgi:hypothetical protein